MTSRQDGVAEDEAPADALVAEGSDADVQKGRRRIDGWPIVAFGVLPVVLLVLGMAAGYLKWTAGTVTADDVARAESVQVAKDTTVALLSYQPETVDQQLSAAAGLLTGDFKNAYVDLTAKTVIPGAKQQKIAAAATVPAAASVSAEPNRAVVMVFVNQATTIGAGTPTNSASVVRVTLDNVGGRWLVSEFDPV